MIKVAINTSDIGISLSLEGLARFIEICPNHPCILDIDDLEIDIDAIDRHDPVLIQVIEELGEKANGDFTNFKIIKLEDSEYEIISRDNSEKIITKKEE